MPPHMTSREGNYYAVAIVQVNIIITGSAKKVQVVKDERLCGEWLDGGRGNTTNISERNNSKSVVMPLLTEV